MSYHVRSWLLALLLIAAFALIVSCASWLPEQLGSHLPPAYSMEDR